MYLLVTQDGATSRTRYYERATMLIKRAVLMLMLFPYLVKTDKMIADMLTKVLPRPGFQRMRTAVMTNQHVNDDHE